MDFQPIQSVKVPYSSPNLLISPSSIQKSMDKNIRDREKSSDDRHFLSTGFNNKERNISDSESTIKSLSADSSSSTSIVSDDSLPSSSSTLLLPSYFLLSPQGGGKKLNGTVASSIDNKTTTQNYNFNYPNGLPTVPEQSNMNIPRKGILKHNTERIVIADNYPSFSSSTTTTSTCSTSVPTFLNLLSSSTSRISPSAKHYINTNHNNRRLSTDSNEADTEDDINNMKNDTPILMSTTTTYSHRLEEAGKHSPPLKHHNHHHPIYHDSNVEAAKLSYPKHICTNIDNDDDTTLSPYVTSSSNTAMDSSSSSSRTSSSSTISMVNNSSNNPSTVGKPLLPTTYYEKKHNHTYTLSVPVIKSSLLENIPKIEVDDSLYTSTNNNNRSVRISTQADVYIYTPRTIISEASDTDTSPSVSSTQSTPIHYTSGTNMKSNSLTHESTSTTTHHHHQTNENHLAISNDGLMRQISTESSSSTLSGVSESTNTSESSTSSNGPPMLRIRTRTTAHQEIEVPTTENPWAVSPEKAGKPHFFNLRRSLSGLGRYSDEENDNESSIELHRSTSEPTCLPSRIPISTTVSSGNNTNSITHDVHNLISPHSKRHYNEAFYGPSTKRYSNNDEISPSLEENNNNNSIPTIIVQGANACKNTESTGCICHKHKRRETETNRHNNSNSIISTTVSSSTASTASSNHLSTSVTEKVKLTITSPSGIIHKEHDMSTCITSDGSTTPSSMSESTGLTPALHIIRIKK